MKEKKAKVNVNVSKNELTWEFADGETETIDVGLFPPEIVQHATLHGLKQKLSDSYAGAGTVTEARERFVAVLESLLNGQWNAGRSSSGGVWVEALARAAGVDVETALEKWNGMDEETQKDVKKDARVKAAKAEIELERAQAKAKDAQPLKL